MPKQHYFFKLIPPRPTFMKDMTDEERRLMVGVTLKSSSRLAGFFCSAP
jgi:hypothetical protein